ncbi:uroporphyrinogen-III synthase [uncultured Methanobrevibacter sp.]|uniref:uroporphyrinogen-III synthase n=1 Tax=uncultured Methanobrevibacter sp. TaxID=253161 RepID=UPI0025FDDE80|nr:uroporphyrinogen-III synthase [uncultured Methanobrevibacter sp.]
MNNKKLIALTRPVSRSDEAKKLIESYKAEALIVPTLEIELLNSPTLKTFMEEVENMDWLIFTSVSSLDSIYKYYPDFNEKINNKCKTAVIGHKTAEVAEKYGLKVDLIPRDYTAEGLLESFEDINIKNQCIGIPRTYSARKLLPEELEKRGAKVILAESYKSILPKDTSKIDNLITKILNKEVDAITFTSPLTVHNLFKVADKRSDDLAIGLSDYLLCVSIGPITAKALDTYNVKYVYPDRYTVKDMIELMFDMI